MADVTTSVRRFLRLRTHPARREPDFADLGTAFGLEMSLRPVETAPAATPTGDGRSWWQRRSGQPRRPGG